MWMPTEYSQALLMLLLSMLCWGSWANALKLMRNCRFELFYWDYVFGTTLISIVLAFTLGSLGAAGPSFIQDLRQASGISIVYAFAGGVVFNIANILLTGAIEVAGLAVAFPVGVGLSIIIGVLLNYVITPKNDPILLFGGVGLLIIAIVVDAIAFRLHSASQKKPTTTGIVLCIVSGIGLGLFYPLVAKSISVPQHLGPYAIGVVFMAGMLVSNLMVNTAVMRRPVTGQPPLALDAYFRMPAQWHWLGLLIGGAVWGTGTVLNFVASGTGLVGPATSFALGDGATMVSAIWGVFVWREFRGATVVVKRLLTVMFLLFVIGLGSIALSPVIELTALLRTPP
jgi:glucose uptake protein